MTLSQCQKSCFFSLCVGVQIFCRMGVHRCLFTLSRGTYSDPRHHYFFRIGADIGMQGKWPNLGQDRNLDNQLSNAISVQILSIEPQDQHQPIHRVPVNGSSTIVRFSE